METVRAIAKDLWVIDHPFRMPGGIELGTRSTIIRLSSGRLWLHSPGPLTLSTRKWFGENGPIDAIVAPNLLHHLFLKDTVDAFPDATVYGPPGLGAKVDMEFEAIGGDTTADGGTPWHADIETTLVPGCPRMNELVFFHASTRTLVVTDLAFNFRTATSFVTRTFLWLNGALDSFGPSRLAKRVFLKDHAAVRAGLDRILAWDFDRVVLAHGDVLETGGREALEASYAWIRQA